jgi:hypothetical protein
MPCFAECGLITEMGWAILRPESDQHPTEYEDNIVARSY